MLIGAVSRNRVAREDPLRSKDLKELGSEPCEYLGELCSQQRTASVRTLMCLKNSKESKVRTQQGNR